MLKLHIFFEFAIATIRHYLQRPFNIWHPDIKQIHLFALQNFIGAINLNIWMKRLRCIVRGN